MEIERDVRKSADQTEGAARESGVWAWPLMQRCRGKRDGSNEKRREEDDDDDHDDIVASDRNHEHT